ncbi:MULTISPECIES: Lsr2 family protein [Streptacidiphilus]|uniref:Lsr2 family protein n=1 Tax=Streptacidiphilus cavernicola TaxID=3342716 RepID=A0ABV6UXC6_9ACTN|nr:Lsr2 family protein [Streptacidiphilus jeojiense]
MARRMVMVDDLDGKSEAAETVTWGMDSEWYELDLSEVNAAKFRGQLEPYKAASRPISPPRRARNGDESQAIRDWAMRNGRPISDKCPIPTDVRQAYERAQAGGK